MAFRGSDEWWKKPTPYFPVLDEWLGRPWQTEEAGRTWSGPYLTLDSIKSVRPCKQLPPVFSFQAFISSRVSLINFVISLLIFRHFAPAFHVLAIQIYISTRTTCFHTARFYLLTLEPQKLKFEKGTTSFPGKSILAAARWKTRCSPWPC
ncbi:hypothetical protein P153DRAFT_60131 [Dothidotthia symphoricarpi CBS 119687]|uniref:Uncharacterized protein n=1 Tax=Dothidotthia symphoricarpi CBS 119687 TaxID=1392245 RepID=A0A6A6A7K6_9PLEO|nr:uncharacterized protein P153DRAFT_60131 [Dothidotthia symphoricarpi CBS 119687]KAF2127133.1 hypothetical protein P153DRAFT_60131 [Dothidotthia symphoricarpi CBS 119687]